MRRLHACLPGAWRHVTLSVLDAHDVGARVVPTAGQVWALPPSAPGRTVSSRRLVARDRELVGQRHDWSAAARPVREAVARLPLRG